MNNAILPCTRDARCHVSNALVLSTARIAVEGCVGQYGVGLRKEKTGNSAGLIALANSSGLRLATNVRIRGRTINACTANAQATVNMYQPNLPNTSIP